MARVKNGLVVRLNVHTGIDEAFRRAMSSSEMSTDKDNSSKSQQFLWKTVKESMAEPFAPSLHEDPGIQGRRRSNPPVRCRDLRSLSEADQTTRAVSPTLLALHTWHQMARPRAESPQEGQPGQHRVHLASGAAALGWPRHKDGRRTHAQKQSSSASSKKESAIVVLQESVTKIS